MIPGWIEIHACRNKLVGFYLCWTGLVIGQKNVGARVEIWLFKKHIMSNGCGMRIWKRGTIAHYGCLFRVKNVCIQCGCAFCSIES